MTATLVDLATNGRRAKPRGVPITTLAAGEAVTVDGVAVRLATASCRLALATEAAAPSSGERVIPWSRIESVRIVED